LDEGGAAVEQFLNTKTLLIKSDVFSLGLTLIEVMSLRSVEFLNEK